MNDNELRQAVHGSRRNMEPLLDSLLPHVVYPENT